EAAGVAVWRPHRQATAKIRTAGERAARIDGDDSDAPSLFAERSRQPIDERALPGPWGPRHTEEIRAPRPRVDATDQIGAGRLFILDKRDRAGDAAPIPPAYA